MTHYTARVQLGQVIVRDVRLPEGTEVKVSIKLGIPALELTPEAGVKMDEALAELRRGETVSGEEALTNFRRFQAELRGESARTRGTGSSRSGGSVDRKPRTGAKPPRRRARGRVA